LTVIYKYNLLRSLSLKARTGKGFKSIINFLNAHSILRCALL